MSELPERGEQAATISEGSIQSTLQYLGRTNRYGSRGDVQSLFQKLAEEQPNLCGHAFWAAVTEPTLEDALPIYRLLVWSFFHRVHGKRLPRVSRDGLARAQRAVREGRGSGTGLSEAATAEFLRRSQPYLVREFVGLLEEDMEKKMLSPVEAAEMFHAVQVMVEAFDAVVSGRVAGEELKPLVNDPTPGRNDPCPCGSGRKYKKCHGA